MICGGKWEVYSTNMYNWWDEMEHANVRDDCLEINIRRGPQLSSLRIDGGVGPWSTIGGAGV